MIKNMVTETRQKVGLDIVFTSSEAVELTKQVVKDRHTQPERAVGFGSPKLNKYLIPSWPGDLELICGRPGNYKTGYMQTRIQIATNDIIKQEAYNECTILVTWEVSVEQAMAYWLAVESGISATDMMSGKVKQWDKLDIAIGKVGSRPMYIIGHSVKRAADGRRGRPNLTTDNVTLALDYIINDLQKEPRLIAMDYLQRVHIPPRMERNEHYLRTVDWAKDMALMSGGTVMLGTQADRRVDDRAIRLPGLRDSQWSSNAEQSADKFISLWMPKQGYFKGDRIDLGPFSATVSDNLLLLSVAKQKYGPAGEVFPLYIEPEYLKLGDMDL